MWYALCFEGDVYHNAILALGERTGQACQDCLENRSVGDELAWGQDLHSPQYLHKKFLFCQVRFLFTMVFDTSRKFIMELGAFRDKRFMYVACPKEFYRFTNVKVFCNDIT